MRWRLEPQISANLADRINVDVTLAVPEGVIIGFQTVKSFPIT